ncbi:MAG: LysR family transcriptional regulator [Ruminococcaceae bacterium]|nr:LysR family transcriptional regulator [Oscillospiraceae bacterium]
MEKTLRAVVSVRLFTDRKSFGPGIAELLRRVDEHHSLRAAAQSMEMAYSKAWTITKNAEEGLGFKLLVSSTGGKGGGGATLTGEAREFLEAYDRYCAKLRAYGDKLLEEEFAFYQRAN